MSDSSIYNWARDRVKPIERAGRYALQWLTAWLLHVWPAPVQARQKILVVRLDKRVGNLLLLTPLLRSLRQIEGVHITLLCHESMARLMEANPFVDAIERYSKWSLFSAKGIPALLARLRRAHYDVAIDAGSFFGAAVTHPLMTRLSGARRFVGPHREPMWRIYHAAVPVLPEDASDIDQRLQLLLPFDLSPLREMCFASAAQLDALADKHRAMLPPANTVACVVGARLEERRVSPDVWAAIVKRLHARGHHVLLVWGPGERELAEAVLARAPQAVLAPPTTLEQAAVIFNRIHGVVGHDTGTSHLAVAVGGRTFVMFVCESPTRYGHLGAGRAWIDLRRGIDTSAILRALDAWLSLVKATPLPP